MFDFIGKFAVGLIAIALLVGAVMKDATLRPYDATDKDGLRSGLALRIDYGTGCQYLESIRGGITPRLDVSGKHMCGAAP